MEQGIIPPGVAGHNRSMVTPNFAVMPPQGILESRLQQFYPTGWGDAAYLLYKDVNRDVRFG